MSWSLAIKKKPKKDRPMRIWVPMNNMSTTSNALHQNDDTLSRRKAQKKSVQNHAIMVNEVEKEYATRKVANMDYGGSGEG